MKYTNEVLINLPRQRVVELFDNPDNLKYWQEGLQSFENLSGKPGEVGTKSKLTFDMGGRKMEMIETILKRDLPDEFSGTYEAPGVFNIVENHFSEVDANTTRYVSVNEFRFTNFMMKMIGFLMPGSFKKTSQKYLEDFKKFAEAA
jgi:hypothetical protein